MQVSSNNINLEVQEFGHKDNIPLIMISGFGSQLSDWPINLKNICASCKHTAFHREHLERRMSVSEPQKLKVNFLP